MELTFIGTGSGRTSLKRFHTSLLIHSASSKLLVDTGDGISKALLKQKINFDEINSILFSHYHADHFGGLAALITQMKLVERTNSLKIYTHKNLVQPVRDYLNYCYLFEKHLGFELTIETFKFDSNVKISDNISFKAKRNTHVRDKYNIGETEKIKFVSSSFLFSVEDSKFIYTSDIGSVDDLMLFNETEIEFFIMETTHLSNLEDIIKVYKRINPGKIYLTHIEESDELNLKNWINNLDIALKTRIFITYDGMKI